MSAAQHHAQGLVTNRRVIQIVRQLGAAREADVETACVNAGERRKSRGVSGGSKVGTEPANRPDIHQFPVVLVGRGSGHKLGAGVVVSG